MSQNKSDSNQVEKKEPKKRGRKAKVKTPEKADILKVPKKRGRKPKGGKIITISSQQMDNKLPEPNIILHLKCSLEDLNTNNFISSIAYNPKVEPIETFQFEQSNLEMNIHNIEDKNYEEKIESYEKNEYSSDNSKIIWNKLRQLTTSLHTNNISDDRCACFWCTCDFDNPPIYIPKMEINSLYHCYGCFCSPECAAAHLFNEHVDSAIKFERYHILNHLYCKIYDYKKNIKPAPNPYYTLDKYYGTLSIQQYRQLLKNERLLLVVDKPLVRIMPELHEDNDDFVLNSNTIPVGKKYQVKKKVHQSKCDIMSENFNFR